MDFLSRAAQSCGSSCEKREGKPFTSRWDGGAHVSASSSTHSDRRFLSRADRILSNSRRAFGSSSLSELRVELLRASAFGALSEKKAPLEGIVMCTIN